MLGDYTAHSVGEDEIRVLCGELDIGPLTARCLLARGIKGAAAQQFLTPRLAAIRPPHGLADFSQLVSRLGEAVCSGETLGVFGDYDVDGITTAALLCTYLRDIGARCISRVAQRSAGYGFGVLDAAFFADQGCSLVVVGDCGTSDIEAIASAVRQGVDILVIDHHTVPKTDPENPHPATALVNPFRRDSSFEFSGMASVGLAFYVVAALRSYLRERNFFAGKHEPDIRELLDLVALGTIADLVPLVAENRILVTHGLRCLSRGRRLGLAALMRVSKVVCSEVDEQDVSWKLAPRINAPGRMGDAAPSLALLLASTPSQASAAAAELEAANQLRRREQERVLDEVNARLPKCLQEGAVVIAGTGWQSGVVGIVAAKIAERYNLPAFVIALDDKTGLGRGSARSARGVNLYESLVAASEHLVRFGGHAEAAGLTLHADKVEPFSCAIRVACAKNAPVGLASTRFVDAAVCLRELDKDVVDELWRLAPFGQANPEPTFATRARVLEARSVGREGSHLKLRVEDAGVVLDAIAFNQAENSPGVGDCVDLVFTPKLSRFGGVEHVELRVDGMCAPSSAARVAQKV